MENDFKIYSVSMSYYGCVVVIARSKKEAIEKFKTAGNFSSLKDYEILTQGCEIVEHEIDEAFMFSHY